MGKENFNEEKQEYMVVKSNDLVQKNRFELSLAEQKAVAYICSMIRPLDQSGVISGDSRQLEYEFDIRTYCKVCGFDYENGNNYNQIKATLKKLSDRSMWIEQDGTEVLCRWLSKIWMSKRSGTVRIRLDEDMVPYLFDLRQRFTQYQREQILGMKSAFSVRIYELMKSYLMQAENPVIFEVEALKHRLMVDNVKSYSDFSLFRKKVIEIALKEINELTDLTITFDTITRGKKVISIIFYISEKAAKGSRVDTLLADEADEEQG